ncbi:hypothetical protein Goshw_021488 [Gossypium schwendimanii]|uniref:33 kDa subunit of oxygen evolving system of photosystem II n=1 Tax=Gossypium schwendimanii TaxID=34291 RepID=A0A7J9MJK7_GOSSC|nr:hypothetical protein [Gossypium schwendimanii]
MAASLPVTTTLMQPTKVGVPSRTGVQLRSFPSVSKGFGLKPIVSGARLTCSLQIDHLKDLAQKCVGTTKIAGFALATFALVLGKYYAKKFYLEPTTFIVQTKRVSKNVPPEFQTTKLMTHLTYSLDEIEGPFKVSPDGTVKIEEKDGIDYAAVIVQLLGGEHVLFLFTIKQLVASGKLESFGGDFFILSYHGSSFLDPKGKGGSIGYDNAVALPASRRGDEEELAK